MPQIDFIISNSGHHVTTFQPIVEGLAAMPDYRCRVLSLCEFRGLPPPVGKFDFDNVDFVEVLPFKKIRKSSSIGSQKGIGGYKFVRTAAREASWHLLLKPKVLACFESRADLVVVANDAAFPLDKICRILRGRKTPFVLVQEGIRFPVPSMSEKESYGAAGAAGVAAWGESSADYFRRQGVADEQIHLTGAPRFDAILAADYRQEAEKLKRDLGLGANVALYLSNPIDDQGFCTTLEKMEIFRRFLKGIEPLFADAEFSLVVKLHTRESVADYESVIAEMPFAERIACFAHGALYPLFTFARAAIVLASTVGLEALMFRVPLGVLKIPAHGFVHDYVSEGAARGLDSDSPLLAEQVRGLMENEADSRTAADAYVARNLATIYNSTPKVVELIRDLTNNKR